MIPQNNKPVQTLDYARLYTALGLGVTPLRQGTKAAYIPGWPHTPTPPEHWETRAADGIAVIHSLSQTAALDIDNEAYARIALRAVGIDLDALFSLPHINTSRSRKFLFRVPPGLVLAHHVLTWPKEEGTGNVVVFELRAGPGKTEVVPPSIHPETGRPYEWVPEPPQRREDIPEIPAELLNIWQRWEVYLPILEACPWCEPVAKKLVLRYKPNKSGRGDSCARQIIDRYNEKHSLEDILVQYGYKRTSSGRYLAPGSSSGSPGVVTFDDGTRTLAYSFHASDVLSDGYAHDAFDVMRIIEYGGDWKAALEAAAVEVGVDCNKPGKASTDVIRLADGRQIDLSAQPDQTASIWHNALQDVPTEVLIETIKLNIGLNVEDVRGALDTMGKGRVTLVIDSWEYEFTVEQLMRFDSVFAVLAVTYGPVSRSLAKRLWPQTAELILEVARRRSVRYERVRTEDVVLDVLAEYFNDIADDIVEDDGTPEGAARFLNALLMRSPVRVNGRFAFHATHFIAYASSVFGARWSAETLGHVLTKKGFRKELLSIQVDGKRIKRRYFIVPGEFAPEPPETEPESPKSELPEPPPSGLHLHVSETQLEDNKARRAVREEIETKLKEFEAKLEALEVEDNTAPSLASSVSREVSSVTQTNESSEGNAALGKGESPSRPTLSLPELLKYLRNTSVMFTVVDGELRGQPPVALTGVEDAVQAHKAELKRLVEAYNGKASPRMLLVRYEAEHALREVNSLLDLLQILAERQVLLRANGDTLMISPEWALLGLHDAIRTYKAELLRLTRSFGGPILASGPLERYRKELEALDQKKLETSDLEALRFSS